MIQSKIEFERRNFSDFECFCMHESFKFRKKLKLQTTLNLELPFTEHIEELRQRSFYVGLGIILISLLYDNSNVFKIENDEWFMNLLLLLFDYLQAFQRVLPVICNM